MLKTRVHIVAWLACALSAVAQAGLQVSVSSDLPGTVTIGNAVTVHISIVNSSTGVNANETVHINNILYTPSCGSSGLSGCVAPYLDPNVFAVPGSAAGSSGTCANATFDVVPSMGVAGVVELVPNGTLDLGPANGLMGMASCKITFTITPLMMPTKDADKQAAGVQTVQFVSLNATGLVTFAVQEPGSFNVTTVSSGATATAPDTTPPTAPGGLSASAAGPKSINLSWAASADTGGSGVHGYLIERCTGARCSAFAEFGQTPATEYVNGDLNPGTTYGYRVRARDQAGNLGAYSDVAAATTLPGKPTGCKATITTALNPLTALGGKAQLAVSGCTPASGLSYNWTRDNVSGWSTLQDPEENLPRNDSSSAVTHTYQVRVCNGADCDTFPKTALTAVVPFNVACDSAATINGAPSVLLPAAGGPVALSVTTTCTSPSQAVTYRWTRNGATVSNAAAWTDTPADNPLLGANANSTYAISRYQVEVCGTTCETAPTELDTPLTALVAPAGGAPRSAVEFYHAGLDHYFVTWVDDEIAALVSGTTIKGWLPTGQSFTTLTAAQRGTSPVCRFYIPPPANSHFFGQGTAECEAIARNNSGFVLEYAAFMHMYLPVGGVCPANTSPVYRIFNNRPDANQRYLTDMGLRDEMVDLDWVAEGDGPNRVVMCAPLAGVAPAG